MSHSNCSIICSKKKPLTFAKEMASHPIILGMDAIISDCTNNEIIDESMICDRLKKKKKGVVCCSVLYPFPANVLGNLATGDGTNHSADVGKRSKHRELRQAKLIKNQESIVRDQFNSKEKESEGIELLLQRERGLGLGWWRPEWGMSIRRWSRTGWVRGRRWGCRGRRRRMSPWWRRQRIRACPSGSTASTPSPSCTSSPCAGTASSAPHPPLRSHLLENSSLTRRAMVFPPPFLTFFFSFFSGTI